MRAGLCITTALAVLFAASAARADALSQERVDALPKTQRAAWQSYLGRSNAGWRKDHETLLAEVLAEGLKKPLPAPKGGDFKLPNHPDAAWFASDDTQKLSTVIISFQTPSGGWSKKLSFNEGARKPGMDWSSQNIPDELWHYVGTFDNRATTEEMRLLAGMWLAVKRQDCADAFLRGLDYIFAAQFPNGGWPQVWPLEGKYHDDITFNDDAMTHILELLRDVCDRKPEFAFVDDARRMQAQRALGAGVDCILKSQVKQGGKLTVWCAQHDPLTLAPSHARLKEPASLSGGESVEIVHFLMRAPVQTPEIVSAIDGALNWFEQTKITNIEKTTKDGHSTYLPVAHAARPLWARFCDVTTNKPLFAGAQDGVIYDTFSEMQAHNHIGYDYYTSQPEALITKDQAKWRKKLNASQK